MDLEKALIIKDALVGVHNGEYCNKPNNPTAHSMFSVMCQHRGVNVSAGFIPDEAFANLLIECGEALLDKHK